MAAVKLYDLAVKTGSYTDRNTGAEKGRYQNVGSVLQMDDGSKMILLSRSFNPAGVPFKDGSDQIIISMFKPKEADGNSGSHEPASTPAQQRARPASTNAAAAGFDDDMPF